MNESTLLYYSSNPVLANYLCEQLGPQGYELQAFDPGIRRKSPVLLLFSPVWHHDMYISCDKSWKKYLSIKSPKIRLISIGLRNEQHPNYIDVLNLPKDFGQFFKNARTVSEEWEPVDTWGLDIEEKLKRFLEGHGADSIREIFTPINRTLKITHDELMQGTSFKELEENIIKPGNLHKKWQIFRNRFTNYYPFFGCLPFFDLFRKINISITHIHPFFQANYNTPEHFLSKEWMAELKNINLLLSEIETYA